VVLSPEGQEDLRELRDYIARESSRRKADNYIRRVAKFYKSLAIAPHRGEQRFSQRPGMRSIGFEHRISILFSVSDEDRRVEILGFFYGGRNVESLDSQNS
jgi:toxin ParE1/3/4